MRSRRAGLSTTRKLLFSGVISIAFLGALELSLWGLGVDPVMVSSDPYVGFEGGSPLFVPDPEDPDLLVTAPAKRTFFNVQRFAPEKPDGAWRAFALGGSSTFGRPFRDETSFSGWLRGMLASDPSKDWEVINAGGISYASYRVAIVAEEVLRYDPDLLIVYSGHNEFLERRSYETIIEAHPTATALQSLLYRSRLIGLGLANRQTQASAQGAENREDLLGSEVQTLLESTAGLDAYRRDDLLSEQILQHYRFNIERVISMARQNGVDVVLVTPISNTSDFSPFKSQHTDGLTPEQRAAWSAETDAADAARAAGDWGAARSALERAVEIDPRHAHTWFALGEAARAEGDLEAANRAFARALDEDVAPLRALGAINEILREIAAARDVPLIDLERVMMARALEDGLDSVGNGGFLDHVHPTIAVHGILASLLFDHLVAHGVATAPADWGPDDVAAVGQAIDAALSPRDHAVALRNLVMVLNWSGKRDEARVLLDRIGGELDEDPVTLVFRAEHLLADGEYAAAIALLERSRDLGGDPAAWTWYTLGRAQMDTGDLAAAEESFQEALSRNPELQKSRILLAKIYRHRGQLAAAAAQYQALLEAEPENVTALVGMGVISGQSGRDEQSLALLQRALAIEPDHPGARSALGSTLLTLGRAPEAVEALTRATELQPGSAHNRMELARALMALDRRDEAVAQLQQILAARPEHPGATQLLAAIQGAP